MPDTQFESDFEASQFALRQQKLAEIGRLGQSEGLSPADATLPQHLPPQARRRLPRPHLARVPHHPRPPRRLHRHPTPRHRRIPPRHPRPSLPRRPSHADPHPGQGRLRPAPAVRPAPPDLRPQRRGRRPQFALFKLLDLGDHIGVRGHLFITRTGETTLHVTALRFLAKALLALPDKYHGLEDVELRYRQRYVDLFMNTGQRSAEKPVDRTGDTPGAPSFSESSSRKGWGIETKLRPPFLLTLRVPHSSRSLTPR